ncbi:MAG TPA: DNA polymerase I [Pseudomonadales bacterium]|nr:DNA polymerase I [Pseudomonadales bacterium]
MKNADCILVDGSSYLYRAFHALPPLATSKGQPTGAIKGVVNMLRSLRKDYPHSAMAVVFDAKGDTFRNKMYAEYKANRPPMPDDLRSQVQPLLDIIRAMGLPLLIVDGVEADDVIGTLAMQARQHKHEVLISTGDKDMAQLVGPHVTLVNTMTNTVMDREGVIEKFGIAPEQIVDYLALMGDKVDNIPGVDKCGPKTAVKWLQEYGTLDNVMANADNIGGKIGENLRAALSFLPLSQQLATIKTDVALTQNWQDLQPTEPARDTLLALFTEMEFKSWINEISSGGDVIAAVKERGNMQDIFAEPTTTTEPEKTTETEAAAENTATYATITDMAELQRWIKKLESAPCFAFDTETDQLDYMQANIVGLSFATASGEAMYIPVAHDYLGAPEQLTRGETLQALQPLLESHQHKKVMQHGKYDMNVLARAGITLRGVAYDTMLESYILDSVATRHNMDALALKYLDYTTVGFEDIAGKGANQLTFNQIDLEKASFYAAEDADITLRLHETLWPQLTAEPSLQSVFENIEIPLIPVLSKIERNGVLVDAKILHEHSIELGERMHQLTQQAFELAGQEFNLGSPKQLGEILYNKLQLPALKKTPTGQPSTAEAVLAELALDYPLPKVIMEYRGLSKLKSTYTDKLPQMIDATTGRVHTSYHQAVAATGRLSSTDPNLQNIPVRTEEGRRVRQAFIAAKGYKILAADYSQIELRIMAHLSADAGLCDAFAKGLDIHRATAAEVFGMELDKVTHEQRRSAKAINFGLIYGMSAFGLAKQLQTGRGQAQEYIDLYFSRYPGVLRYMEETRHHAAEKGYVETLFGRRLYLPDIHAKNGGLRQAAERTAINAPMQGTAADIIKRAMIKVDHWLEDANIDARMIMQVHDELVFEVAEHDLETLRNHVKRLMEESADLHVPLVVDTGTGNNWDEAH